MMISGVKFDSDDLEVDSQGRVSSLHNHNDVLLRTAAAAGGGAAPPGDDVEEELQELVSDMVKLKVGRKKACAAFARSLAAAGVMSLEELRPLPHVKARGVLEKSGMQELQIDLLWFGSAATDGTISRASKK